MRRAIQILLVVFIGVCAIIAYRAFVRTIHQNEVLKKVISRLEADSRVAEVLVTDVAPDPMTGAVKTTIKFLEYDSGGQPLAPRYFSFSGNIIQFQSLVIRFDDKYIRISDAFRGKSAYLFWKVFMLDGARTQEYEITSLYEIPSGYKIPGESDWFEKELWQDFWRTAMSLEYAQKRGVKNAQIEAPGTRFIPGYLYTIKIEHDGGLRIDTQQLPSILKGERILE